MTTAMTHDGGTADVVTMPLDDVRTLTRKVLLHLGLAERHANAVAETMVAGERGTNVSRTVSIACW